MNKLEGKDKLSDFIYAGTKDAGYLEKELLKLSFAMNASPVSVVIFLSGCIFLIAAIIQKK